MSRLIDTSELHNVVTRRKDEYGRLAVEVANIVEEMVRETPTVQAIRLDKVKQAIEEIEQTLYVDSLIFGELIDFKDGKISADDVIEEFNRVTRKEVLEIIKRNVGEKTNESNY